MKRSGSKRRCVALVRFEPYGAPPRRSRRQGHSRTIAWAALPLLLVIGTAAVAAKLPLRPGAYVLSSTSCRDPAFAATFVYDGDHFVYPHATKCRSIVQSRSGRTYHVAETCSALGDGSAAMPDRTETTYTILSRVLVEVNRGRANGGSSYRWCSSVNSERP